MKIVGHLKPYGAKHGGGIETFLVLMRELQRRGHDTEMVTGPDSPRIQAAYRRAEMILTQRAIALTSVQRAGRRAVVLAHNVAQPMRYGWTPETCALAVFNARWVQEATRWPGESIVLNPPVFAGDYRTKPGDAVTLVNLSEAKGGQLFWRVANLMPKRRFLGVVGGWGRQIMGSAMNVTIQPHTRNMRSVYARTRVLLMPSQFNTTGWTESYGRCGLEAAASGIPTIAHPTPGLRESLGDAAIFVDRDDVNGWVEAIKSLDDPVEYGRWFAAALRRSAEMDPAPQIDVLERQLARIAETETAHV